LGLHLKALELQIRMEGYKNQVAGECH
jgi:hypothetical protein